MTNRSSWSPLAVVLTIVASSAQLHWQGRRWWCDCGQPSFWVSDVWGKHNSQHLLDPYAFTHVSHGILLCGLLTVILPRMAAYWRLTLAMGLECAWEIVENSPLIIDRYRAATAAQGYEGDSIANSLGDIFSCAVGFWIAQRLGIWRSLAVFLAIEFVLLLLIRDNLILNIVMLIYPVEALRIWQRGT